MTQQNPTISFTLSLNDYNVVLEGLGELAAKKSHRVLQSLQYQALTQLNEMAKKAEAEKPQVEKEQIAAAAAKRARKAEKFGNGAARPQDAAKA